MLLNFNRSHSMLVLRITMFFIVSIFCINFVYAQNLSNNDLKVHGFISQGVIDVSGSDYVNDDQELSAELTEVGLNASYKINSSLRLAGQVVYIEGGNRYNQGSRIDYLLVDWSAYSELEWQLNVYLGRFKNHHWLYSSTRDVPFTRPSIILPQSVYFDGFRDMSVGGDGLAAKLSHSSDEFGEFDINFSVGTSNISDEQTEIILSGFAKGDMEHDTDYQASIYWQPVDSQWRFGLALLDSDFSYDASEVDNFVDADITIQRLLLNGLYEGENWEFSTEFIQENFEMAGFYNERFSQDNTGQGAFVQARYKFDNSLTLLGRVEKFYANKDDKNGSELEESTRGAVPSYFGYQDDATIGISYDFTSNLRLQIEHHWVKGTARLTPVVLPNPQLNSNEYWQLWAAQLMYWF